MSKHHLHPALADLYAKHPRQAPQLNAAYEAGLGDLKQVLENSPRRKPPVPDAASCINDFPTPFVHVLNTAILARALDLTLPHFYEAVSKDERRLTGGLQGQVQQFLRNTGRILDQWGVFKPTAEQSREQAAQQFLEDMADLVYECLHELNKCDDPRLPHAAMLMFNELNMVAADPAPATETAP